MRLLLDTHALLWWLEDSVELSADARDRIADGSNEVVVSAASAWEMAIKQATGKLRVPDDLVAALEASVLATLPITFDHALRAGSLPPHHQDPFDRMLIAQAMIEGLTIVTRDPHFEPYGVPRLVA
jgi:PIN domain nuclease of toxin-antitoxin system